MLRGVLTSCATDAAKLRRRRSSSSMASAMALKAWPIWPNSSSPTTETRCERSPAASARALASLHEEVMRMGRLIADLESLAYADAAVFSLHRVPTDLAELVKGAVTEFAGPYAAEGLRLESDLTSMEADVDPVRIRQAISNLLSNSLKFTREGGRVLIEVAPEDGEAVIRVTDTGSGIAEDELPRVFDRFFRGSGARPAGSGIGLTVVQELVRAHGGRVEIRSAPGQGTTVGIRLPAPGGPVAPLSKRRPSSRGLHSPAAV